MLFRQFEEVAFVRQGLVSPDPERIRRLSRPSSAPSKSSLQSTSSNTSSISRDSILLPLAPLYNLSEVEDSLNQVGFNLAFIDEQLVSCLIAQNVLPKVVHLVLFHLTLSSQSICLQSSGLISTIKCNLAREHLSHPDENFLAMSPSDFGHSRGRSSGSNSIDRLRHSFQTQTSSSRQRRMSSSTGSSWWSEARSVYTPDQIEKLKTDLDQVFR